MTTRRIDDYPSVNPASNPACYLASDAHIRQLFITNLLLMGFSNDTDMIAALGSTSTNNITSSTFNGQSPRILEAVVYFLMFRIDPIETVEVLKPSFPTLGNPGKVRDFKLIAYKQLEKLHKQGRLSSAIVRKSSLDEAGARLYSLLWSLSSLALSIDQVRKFPSAQPPPSFIKPDSSNTSTQHRLRRLAMAHVVKEMHRFLGRTRLIQERQNDLVQCVDEMIVIHNHLEIRLMKIREAIAVFEENATCDVLSPEQSNIRMKLSAFARAAWVSLGEILKQCLRDVSSIARIVCRDIRLHQVNGERFSKNKTLKFDESSLSIDDIFSKWVAVSIQLLDGLLLSPLHSPSIDAMSHLIQHCKRLVMIFDLCSPNICESETFLNTQLQAQIRHFHSSIDFILKSFKLLNVNMNSSDVASFLQPVSEPSVFSFVPGTTPHRLGTTSSSSKEVVTSDTSIPDNDVLSASRESIEVKFRQLFTTYLSFSELRDRPFVSQLNRRVSDEPLSAIKEDLQQASLHDLDDNKKKNCNNVPSTPMDARIGIPTSMTPRTNDFLSFLASPSGHGWRGDSSLSFIPRFEEAADAMVNFMCVSPR